MLKTGVKDLRENSEGYVAADEATLMRHPR